MSFLQSWSAVSHGEMLLRKLDQMVFDIEDFDDVIANEWIEYEANLRLQELKKRPIEDVAKIRKGISVRLLKGAGIHTVLDAFNRPERYFTQIKGIGHKSARRIVGGVRQIANETKVSFRLRDDVHSRPLLDALYRKLLFVESQSDIQHFQFEKSKVVRELRLLINDAYLKRSILPYLFGSDKDGINQSIQRILQYDLSRVLNEYKNLLHQLDPVINGTPTLMRTTVYDDFNKRSIEYYKALEDALDIDINHENTHLSDELIDDVEREHLSTRELSLSVRGYQMFASKYILRQKRTLIGDEMGLGKTIEALVAMNHLYHHGNARYFVVVVPLSVMTNWIREIKKWTEMKTYKFHGPTREREYLTWMSYGGVLITTYGTSHHIRLAEIGKIDMLVVDEAHKVKNPEARRSQAVYRIGRHAEYVTYMTGTPLENNVDEMVQLISQLQPNIARKISYNNKGLAMNEDEFKKTISPVYLRRNREDVLHELPEIDIVRHYVDFGQSELAYYRQAIANQHVMRMRQAAWYGQSPDRSPKLNALLEIVNQAKAEGHKVLVFSYFRGVLDVIEKALGNQVVDQINGNVSGPKRQEILDTFDESKHGSVLLSQITAGGEGLNIQSANIVILCEPQYKPSIEQQAISRVYRMGQTKDVMVYRILVENSIDDLILDRLLEKQELFDQYAKDSHAADSSKDATNAELKQIQKDILLIEAKKHNIQL